MKKILFALGLVTVCSVYAQAQISIGIKAGGNLSEQRVNSSEGTFFSNNHYRGYHAGLVAEVEVAKNLYLQPQLLYTRKGSTLLSSVGAADTKVKINYLEVPVYVMYKLPLPFGKVFGGAGAGFSYALGGKLQQNGHSQKMYKGNNNDWKREDISLNFTAGIEFNNGLFASINSQKGLRDIYKPANTSIKNRSLSVSVGYMIDWNKLKGKKS